MGSSDTKAKSPNRRSRSTAGDAFVVLAMTLTTVALAIGLYLQFRLAFWLAVVAALSVYVGLLALHVLVRRSERVEHLTAEIQRLEAELTHASAHGRTGAAAGAAAASAVAPSAIIANTLGPIAHGPTGYGPTAQGMPTAPPLPTAAMTPPAASQAGIGAMAPRQGPSTMPLPPPMAPAIVADAGPPQRDGKARPDGVLGRMGPQSAASGSPEQPPQQAAEPADRGGMTDRAVDAIMNDYWAFRPAQAPRLPEPQVPAPAASNARIGEPPLARVSEEAIASSEIKPNVSMPSPQPPATKTNDPRPHAATPPPVPSTPPPMPSSPRQSDVEMIGGLIKKMADEINAVEADRLRHPAGRDRVPPAAIEASVNALRTTADQMRGGSAPPPEPIRAAATAPESRWSQAANSEAPVPPRQRTAETPPAWSEPAPRAAAERAADEKPLPRVAEAIIPPPLPAPPPLPTRQSAPPAPVRHAMERPAARELPPPAEPANFAPLPWPEETEASGSTGGTRPAASANEIVVPAETPVQPPSIGHSRLAALAEAITAGRLDVLLDPILGLADQRARHYEVSVRLRDKTGNVLEPPDGVPELRESGLLPLLDCARIQRSAQVATRLSDRGKPGSLFSAFSGESLSHDQFLTDFADVYAAREEISAQLVLSFGQADVRAFASRDWDTIAEMHELGFRFALQSVTDLDFDLEALKAAGFDFVKLDASVFLDGMPASGGVIPAADICRHIAQLGMTLIVGQIADEAQLARIFGFGVIYGQGQLFGGARPMKSEALSGAGHAAA